MSRVMERRRMLTITHAIVIAFTTPPTFKATFETTKRGYEGFTARAYYMLANDLSCFLFLSSLCMRQQLCQSHIIIQLSQDEMDWSTI
ncbi:hypothetical protein FEM48_Zijuj01G0284200 [Ziziphus jujuba var. spinosa]|uniref:Uncharacterized protein n=1 Tax=Ziziphus jujuba var. spinosa TaxID=714518 RepID=A0A978W5G5_ZIZJJ|nr:hypothetical protein FEM48_Zijuj01G0284200 [Ziziphus jujuba var. spinosa]